MKGGLTIMNILIAVPWDQESGGVASVVGNLAEYFSGKKHKVLFLHPGGRDKLSRGKTKWGFDGYKPRLRVPIVKGHCFRSLVAFLFFFPLTFFQVLWILLFHRIDLVNVHYPTEAFFYFAICRRLLGIKLIISIHGADFFPGGNPRNRCPISLKLLLSSSDYIVAPSKAYLLDFMKLFPRYRNKGHFIHNGINISEMVGTSRGIGEGYLEKYLLCIAAHNEKKGIDVLIQAFLQISEHDPTLQLFLVGDGPLKGEYEQLTKFLGLQNRVRFLGQRGRSDVVRLLRACELLVLPSRSEPFGIVIIEAMACERPVVATRVGGIPEIIENGKNGILVEPDNPDVLAGAIRSVVENEDFGKYLAKNGLARVREKFLWKHAGAKYEKLFRHLHEGSEFGTFYVAPDR